jgi:hypothetical protein
MGQTISQPIGQTGIRLRLNSNNVPGDPVAGSLQSVSQPIGDIINIRLNQDGKPIDGAFLTWTELRPKGDTDQWWWRACCSNDRQRIYAGIYEAVAGAIIGASQRSTDGGANWTGSGLSGGGASYVCSGDGLKSVMSDSQFDSGSTRSLYSTTDGWATPRNEGNFDKTYRVAMDENGVVAIWGRGTYDYGVPSDTYYTDSFFTGSPKFHTTSIQRGVGLAVSHDGSIIIIGQGEHQPWGYTYNGNLYISTDTGASFNIRNPNGTKDYQCVAIDDGGDLIVAVEYGGRVWKTTNLGVNWTEIYPTGVAEDKNWYSLAVSPDGQHILVGVLGGGIYHSDNAGGSFLPISSLYARDIQFNKNGTAAMVATSTRLYMLTDFVPWHTVSQKIGQSGIRIRLNSSNVPGD